MDNIRNWAYSICVICIVGNIILMLTSSYKINKIIKLLIGTIFLIVILSPLKTLNSNFMLSQCIDNHNFNLQARSDEIVKDIFLKNAAENVKNVIIEELKSIYITVDKISVQIQKKENEDIFIKKVIIKLPNEYIMNKDEITRVIKEKLKLENVEIEFLQ